MGRNPGNRISQPPNVQGAKKPPPVEHDVLNQALPEWRLKAKLKNSLPSLKLTVCPLKMVVSNRNLLFQGSVFRGYVSFRVLLVMVKGNQSNRILWTSWKPYRNVKVHFLLDWRKQGAGLPRNFGEPRDLQQSIELGSQGTSNDDMNGAESKQVLTGSLGNATPPLT